MSIGNWFRRLLSPPSSVDSAEEDATLRKEYGIPGDDEAPAQGPDIPLTHSGAGFAPEARRGEPAEAEIGGEDVPSDPNS